MSTKFQFIFGILLMVNVKLINAQEHKFVVDLFTKELEADDIVTVDVTFAKQGDDLILSGEVNQLVDMDDTWTIIPEFLEYDNESGEYQNLLAGLAEMNICAFLKSFYKMYFYETLKNYTNAPDPDNCPVVSEVYKIKDYPVDSSKLQNFLKPGQYRIVLTLSKESEVKAKYILDCHVEEK